MQHANEWMLFCKIKSNDYANVEAAIRAAQAHSNPEIVEVGIDNGAQAYLARPRPPRGTNAFALRLDIAALACQKPLNASPGSPKHAGPEKSASANYGPLIAVAQDAQDEASLEAVRVAALGKKGSIAALLAGLGKMPPEERKERGAPINALKDEVTQALAAGRAVLKEAALEARLKGRSPMSPCRCAGMGSRPG